MVRPVAGYLVNFGPPESNELPAAFTVDPPECPRDEAQCVHSGEAILAARQEALAEGMAIVSRICEEQLTQERQMFENRLAAERDRWAREESEKLSSEIEAAVAELESKIAGCVTRILKPFIMESAPNLMIGRLAENIATLVRGLQSPMLSISGPEDLLSRLRERMTPLVECEYYFNKAADIRVVAGETLIESQLAAFSARLGTPEK